MVSGTAVRKTGLIELIWSFLNVETIALEEVCYP